MRAGMGWGYVTDENTGGRVEAILFFEWGEGRV
ncbi:hypothetical protein AciX9_0450 [Granulicella tundricola MP5ACTX9]|uniref:Uncharacterized protein n=1 Tax=Granulicella tundricola (strain ATCC BAA-1859 / DSM 23138 / MP5ACTX9) TaxID=1198114 RepID=E8WXY3_GRATM|nr:hypothetical protein AciX9_0450 [Granulicella tundricola MP5ACTX9]